MAQKTIKAKYTELAKTKSQWSSANNVLLLGEAGIETDTRAVKIGNGSSAWNSLDYVMGDLQVGTMIDWVGSSVPAGFLVCNGAAVSRSTYAKLYGSIGTKWGSGNGSTTFNVPNISGRLGFGTLSDSSVGVLFGSSSHYHYFDGTTQIGAFEGNLRSLAYAARGKTGQGYTYALQGLSIAQNVNNTNHGTRTLGNSSTSSNPYPNMNMYRIIKYA